MTRPEDLCPLNLHKQGRMEQKADLGGAVGQESGPPGGSQPSSPRSSLSLSPQGSLPGSGPGSREQKPELTDKYGPI